MLIDEHTTKSNRLTNIRFYVRILAPESLLASHASVLILRYLLTLLTSHRQVKGFLQEIGPLRAKLRFSVSTAFKVPESGCGCPPTPWMLHVSLDPDPAHTSTHDTTSSAVYIFPAEPV